MRHRRGSTGPGARGSWQRHLLVAIVLLTALWGGAESASAQSISGQLAPNVTFPQRTLVLSLPQDSSVTPTNVHVTENGVAVSGLRTAPLDTSGNGKLGVVIVVDSDPSMAGQPVTQAMAAARTLAGERSGDQEVGAVYGDGRTLAPTSNQQAIDSFLATPPRIVKATNLLAATRTAVKELQAADVVAGAVIYVSDDMDKAPGISPHSVAAIANAAHVRIFTVAIHDIATGHPGPADLPLSAMRSMAESAGGSFTMDNPSQLRTTFSRIEAALTNEYVVQYKSTQRAGKQVAVSVTVDGVSGSVSFDYLVPVQPGVGTAKRHHGQSFWVSSLAVVLVAFVAAGLFGIALATAVLEYARSRRLRSRVQASLPERVEVEDAAHELVAYESGRAISLLERQRWWPGFATKVDVSSLTISPQRLVAYAILGSVVAAALLDTVTGSVLLAFVGLFVGPLVVRAVVNRSVRKHLMTFMEQLPGQIHEVASAMRTGRSMTEALRVVTDSAPEPTRREFARALADERAGIHLEEALRPIGERMQSEEMEQVAVVAALHRRTGANITEVLDRVADTARMRMEIRRELFALTAQARLSRNVLTALPIVVVIAIDLIGQGYERPLFHTRIGIIIIVVAALMVLTGSQVMKKIVEIKE